MRGDEGKSSGTWRKCGNIQYFEGWLHAHMKAEHPTTVKGYTEKKSGLIA